MNRKLNIAFKTFNNKEEKQWKENIVFKAIRTDNFNVRIRILDQSTTRQHFYYNQIHAG